MKKSTLFMLATLVALLAGILRAAENSPVGASGSDTPTAPPLLLAANPVRLLPGMSAPRSLPAPLITDLTNAPNPFDSRLPGLAGQTQISYQLVKNSTVEVQIYDLLGNKVRAWKFRPGINGGQMGLNTLLWDGTRADGRKVSKGGYLAEIVIETPETTVTAIRKIGVIH